MKRFFWVLYALIIVMLGGLALVFMPLPSANSTEASTAPHLSLEIQIHPDDDYLVPNKEYMVQYSVVNQGATPSTACYGVYKFGGESWITVPIPSIGANEVFVFERELQLPDHLTGSRWGAQMRVETPDDSLEAKFVRSVGDQSS